MASATAQVRPLTEFETELVASLYLHRLLTTSQIYRLHDRGVQVRAVQKKLTRLEAQGYVTKVVGPMPGREYRWFLTGLGAEMAELAGDVPVRKYRMSAHAAASGHAKHLMAVNDVGVALTEAAIVAGDDFDWRRWQHEISHSYGRAADDRLSVDAVVTYDVVTDAGVVTERRFIEVDRGTEDIHTLVEKVHAYRRFSRWEPKRSDAESHLAKTAWKRTYQSFPGVVFVFVGLAAPAAVRRATDLANFCAVDQRLAGVDIEVSITTLDALRAHGPFAAICKRVPTEEHSPMFRRR